MNIKMILFYTILLAIAVLIVIWLDNKKDYVEFSEDTIRDFDEYEMLKPMDYEQKQKLMTTEYINGDKMYKYVYGDAYRDESGYLRCDKIYTYDLEYREEGVEPTIQHSLPTNCKNCGAPLHSYECEYCGSKYY